MRNAARTIGIRDGYILLMKRFKIDKEYFTLPGGRIEPNETPEAAAYRETLEETSIKIANPRLVFLEDSGAPYGIQHVYLCDYVSGEPQLHPDSGEALWTVPGKNPYEPVWLPFAKLDEVPFVSVLLKEALIDARNNGFPDSPRQFSSKHAARLS